MTPKQQLKSIERKMKRIEESLPNINLHETTRNISEINRYSELSTQHFRLKFEIEHCEKCGKKL